jgi:hypothetical protein
VPSVGWWKIEFASGTSPKKAAQIKKWFVHIQYLANDQKLCRMVSENYAVLSSEGRPISWNDLMTATSRRKKKLASVFTTSISPSRPIS